MKPNGRLFCGWLVFLACAIALPRAHARAQEFGPKFQWFDGHKDNFEIVFVGSSRIAHGISPKLFDEIAASHGDHWRSFNLGKDKMKQRECLALARHVAALDPRKLKYLFLELQTTRAGSAGAWQGSGAGLGPEGDGYFPIDRNMTGEMRPRYERFLQAAKAHPGPPAVDPAVRAELGRLQEELKARGIEIVFVVAPSLRGAHGAGVNAPRGSLLFSFDDLDRYASLYAETNRPDAEHLNNRGAEIFTRALAEQFLQALASPRR